MSSVAMVFTPAAPMAKSIVTPVASPDNSSIDRRRVERQQGDESHVDKRIEVNADGQVVEKENLQEHHNGEECEIWERPVHLSVLSGMLFYFLTVLAIRAPP